MSFITGTATDAGDLLDQLDDFLAVGHTLTPAYTGTGTGRLTEALGTAASVLETLTITFTSSTAFGVVGSVTGSMGTGTVGTTFTHAKATFKVVAGGVAWASSDTIVVVMTSPWTQVRGVTGSEYIWTAPGDDDQSEIFVGGLRFSDVGAGYDNIRLGGFIGYDSGSTFLTQPGFVGVPGPVLPLWASSMAFWFLATGRRVIVVAKVSTNFESAYLGYITPYASPTQFPYPLAVGGSMMFESEPALSSSNWRFSYVGVEHQAFPMSNHNNSTVTGGQLRLRKPDGTYLGFRTLGYSQIAPGSIWPYCQTDSGVPMSDLRANLDGSYPTFPVVMTEGTNNDTFGVPQTCNCYGELDGVRATTGFSNAAENTITDGRDVWLVVQNASATTKRDYFVVRLD